jgi:hypothetical protein
MASGPPTQPGQLSPDGMWRWDGVQWLAVGASVQPAVAPRRSRAWVWWLAGGCALLLVIGLVGGAVGVYSLANSFQRGAFSCLPKDFPAYPGVSVTSEQTYVGSNVAPGDSRRCQMTLQSNDDVATVTAFYAEKLDSGDWKVTAFIREGGQIQFHRVSRQATFGLLDLLGRGEHTEIRIQLDS